MPRYIIVCSHCRKVIVTLRNESLVMPEAVVSKLRIKRCPKCGRELNGEVDYSGVECGFSRYEEEKEALVLAV